jgi:hypothetical protein
MFDIFHVDAGRAIGGVHCSMACWCRVNSWRVMEGANLLLDSGVIRVVWTDFFNECLVDSSLQVRVQWKHCIQRRCFGVKTGNAQRHREGKKRPRSQQHRAKDAGLCKYDMVLHRVRWRRGCGQAAFREEVPFPRQPLD